MHVRCVSLPCAARLFVRAAFSGIMLSAELAGSRRSGLPVPLSPAVGWDASPDTELSILCRTGVLDGGTRTEKSAQNHL